MIEIKNLTKIYKVKKKNAITAVNNVTFTLPDKGMVFIVGKSGSGKSTLLNLIGGLDTATSGEIIADGNVVTKLKNRKLTKYRSSYTGFIFQDYHILENFTVRQNVNLAMDIVNKEDENKVNQILQVVDLTLYADRYPSELSGGQKQRISIARALVKDAKVILCDEPTGNLDKKTSNQVLDMLKKISQDKLVVIVSHSIVDANNYADRIIELYDGIIVRDRQRSLNYSNEFKIEDGIIHIPHYRDLTSNELILINETISKSTEELKFKQIDNRFRTTSKITKEMKNVELTSSIVSKKTSKKLFGMFFKHKKGNIIFSVLLASILMVCFAIFQSFLNFDGNTELSKSLTKHNIYSVPLQKGTTDDSGNLKLGTLQAVNNEDIESFAAAGFTGKVYKRYNNTLPIFYSVSSIDSEQTIDYSMIFTMFYATETFGVINCDEEFLASIYGENGKIKYIVQADEQKDYGMMIPDYIADSIIYYDDTKTYNSILGEYKKNNLVYGYINGIFDTNYEEKYEDLITKFKESLENPEEAGQEYSELLESDLFVDYTVECMNYLCYGYNFADDYETTIKNPEFRNFLQLSRFEISIDEEHTTFRSSGFTFFDATDYKRELTEGQVILSLSNYNKLFGYNLTSVDEFIEPADITLNFYADHEQEGEIMFSKTYKLVGLHKSLNLINMDCVDDIREYDVINYGLYLENHENIEMMLNVANERSFVICSIDATKLSTINRVLEVFGQFFLFIELFFLLVTVIFLVNIGLSSIKKNKYEIGILKAIGTSNFDIVRIFIRQSFIVCISICIVANIGIYLGTYAANYVLVSAFEVILDTKFYDLQLINYIPAVVLQDLIYIAATSLLSFIIPQILLFRIKPIDIIRAKE